MAEPEKKSLSQAEKRGKEEKQQQRIIWWVIGLLTIMTLLLFVPIFLAELGVIKPMPSEIQHEVTTLIEDAMKALVAASVVGGGTAGVVRLFSDLSRLFSDKDGRQ